MIRVYWRGGDWINYWKESKFLKYQRILMNSLWYWHGPKRPCRHNFLEIGGLSKFSYLSKLAWSRVHEHYSKLLIPTVQNIRTLRVVSLRVVEYSKRIWKCTIDQAVVYIFYILFYFCICIVYIRNIRYTKYENIRFVYVWRRIESSNGSIVAHSTLNVRQCCWMCWQWTRWMSTLNSIECQHQIECRVVNNKDFVLSRNQQQTS